MTPNAMALSLIDTPRLIEDISNRPAIWNRNFQCSRPLLDDTWNELSRLHKCTVQQLKQKWKNLRDNFRIELKRIPRDGSQLLTAASIEAHQSKWKWFKLMSFLRKIFFIYLYLLTYLLSAILLTVLALSWQFS